MKSTCQPSGWSRAFLVVFRIAIIEPAGLLVLVDLLVAADHAAATEYEPERSRDGRANREDIAHRLAIFGEPRHLEPLL